MGAQRTVRATSDVAAPGSEHAGADKGPPPARGLLRLQASGGNQMVLRMIDDAPSTSSLRVSDPTSPMETQAATIARSGVDAGSATGLSSASPAAGASPVTDSSGQPLADTVRQGFEHSLGADLSQVRVHDNPVAYDFAREVGAKAATVGSHVYFGQDQFAPGSTSGQELLRHELVHTLQPTETVGLYRTPESEARLVEIDQQLSVIVITDEYRAQLMTERQTLLSQGNQQPDPVQLPHPVDVISMTTEEYQALTGQSADQLPEGDLPGLTPEALSPFASGIPATIGNASMFTPQMNWYYRVLATTDPSATQIMGGADLVPRAPDPGNAFQPASSPADMTFRHTRPGGNVPQVGTDRVSTGQNLDSFETLLADRGTGEMVRVDVTAARRLGAEFLENGDIMAHLDEIGRDLQQQLDAARTAGRGRNYVARLESRMRALESAKNYAHGFTEGQGVGSIPSAAISPVEGATLPEAVAAERAFLGNVKVFRYGGRVLVVVGVGMSIARVASAPPDQQPRVAAEEAGGWAFSLGGAAVGAKAGAMAGGALGFETGPGAIIAAALGSLIGGAIGFFAGEKAADAVFDSATAFGEKWVQEAAQSQYQQFLRNNPDATPADYDRMQQTQDDFDSMGLP